MLKAPIGISNRHLHISEPDMVKLFGTGDLHKFKELKQPGQYAAAQKVDLVGPRGQITGVRVLGPTRKQTQIELSRTDAIKLGINPPVRDSGNLQGSAGIVIQGPEGQVELAEGVIIAHRHIHIDPEQATDYELRDGDLVSVLAGGDRGLIFNNVLVRVSSTYVLEFHIDTDEANAALLHNGDLVTVSK